MTEAENQKPSKLSYTRAFYSCAKARKKKHWHMEVLVSVLSGLSVVVPNWKPAAILVFFALAAKLRAKFLLSEAKGLFRQAERCRRYDFEELTLGWPVPARDRADACLVTDEVEVEAKKWAQSEKNYYALSGEPSARRFFGNLIESVFWSERLMGGMCKRRWKQFAAALTVTFIALLAIVLIQPTESASIVVKSLAIVISLFVSLDIFGEARAFQRGEVELSKLLGALSVEGKKVPSEKEIMRIFIEYNCLLAELPMIPDEFYQGSMEKLNKAWMAFQSGIPSLNPP